MTTEKPALTRGVPVAVRAVVAIAIIGGGGGWWAAREGYVSIPGIARAATTSSADRIVASGTIESDASTMTAEVAGRLVAFDVRDGDLLTAGKVLARIEDPMLSAQLDQARLHRRSRRQALRTSVRVPARKRFAPLRRRVTWRRRNSMVLAPPCVTPRRFVRAHKNSMPA